jgi:hypothetical protein
MTLDLLIAVTLTASAAAIVAALSAAAAASAAWRVGLAVLMTAWFFGAVTIAASGLVGTEALGTPGVGLAVVLPLLFAGALAWRWPAVRTALSGIPVSLLIGVNATRIIGVFFVILYAQGRLPAPFAPAAGWGDILVGLTAVPLALLAAYGALGWRPLTLIWNALGLADLVLAIGLGVASAADSPFRIFHATPDSGAMSALPMFLIPGFLVPLLLMTHVALFGRLLGGEKRGLARFAAA